MKDLSYLDKKRVPLFKGGPLGDSHNGAFKVEFQGKRYFIIASNGDGWEHVSISSQSTTPNWEAMCHFKDMFFEEDECVIQYHPAKENYINLAENCLHLWRPIDGEIPIPPTYMVGPKKLKNL